MNAVTWIHIAGGAMALACGTAAIVVRKGGNAHVRAGTWFCLSMFVLGITASILAPLKSPPESPLGGIMVCYFIATAWMAARRRDGVPRLFEKIACAVVLGIAAATIAAGIVAARSPPSLMPPGPGALLGLGAVCLLAGALDVRFILLGSLSRVQRLRRHLWRMCFALFIATGSFFLGQQDVMPQAVRGSPWLIVLAVAPIALMMYWLVHVAASRARITMR